MVTIQKKKIIFEKFSWSDGSKGPEEEYEEKRLKKSQILAIDIIIQDTFFLIII